MPSKRKNVCRNKVDLSENIRKSILMTVVFSAFSFISCKENGNSQMLESPSNAAIHGEANFEKVQGIVLKLEAVEVSDSSSVSRNDIYYVYNLHEQEPNIGVDRNSDSKLAEDDLITVMMNSEDTSLSYIDRRGMEDQELLYQYLKRADSSYSKMKERVPFTQR